MRFDLKGNMGDVKLSQNARVVLECACVPGVTNMTARPVTVRLATSTQDRVFDNGNSILFSIGTSTTANIPNMIYNGSEFFIVKCTIKFFTKDFIEIKIEAPTQNTTAINFINGLGGLFCTFKYYRCRPRTNIR